MTKTEWLRSPQITETEIMSEFSQEANREDILRMGGRDSHA